MRTLVQSLQQCLLSLNITPVRFLPLAQICYARCGITRNQKNERFPLIDGRPFTTYFWTTACLTVNPQLAFPRRLLHQARGTHSRALFRKKHMVNEKTLSSTCYAQVSV